MVVMPGMHFSNLFLPHENVTSESDSSKTKDESTQEQHLTFPPFSSLPLDPNGPRGNAWGLYSPSLPSSSSSNPSTTTPLSQTKDELGALNLLTPNTTLNAAKEIQQGIRIATDWRLDRPRHACFGRRKFEHRIVNKGPRIVNDDVVEFNTQSGSQWDGFRHFGKAFSIPFALQVMVRREGEGVREMWEECA